MEIRPLLKQEQNYIYAQSSQLDGQTGKIGYLRGDFDSDGEGFFTAWFDSRPEWKTDEFKAELDAVINALRSRKLRLLVGRNAMRNFVKKFPDSTIQGSRGSEYGFRVDTEKYAYLLRCNPTKGDYNFYCYCFIKKWLDHHVSEASRGIRFITPDYTEMFRIPDGGTIIITNNSGEEAERVCRYIDDYHMEVGRNLFHICEFAERMQCIGSSYAPKAGE